MKFTKYFQNKKAALVALVTTAPAALVAYTSAGGSGSATANDFDTALDRVIEWSEGSLGTMLAVTFLLAGIAMGLMRQSIAAVIPGIAAAIALSEGPTILGSVFGASV